MMPFVFVIALFFTADISRASFTDTRPRDSYGWVLCKTTGRFSPLNDAQAADLVIGMTENRPDNTSANNYKPSSGELSAFLKNETNKYGKLPAQSNPYAIYVTGGFVGTTDEIIQWGAAKWGIPADWVRAQYYQESRWHQSALGDLTTVSDVTKYPAHSRYSSTQVYQSLGIAQVKWNHPDENKSGIGTEPLRWKSTAFNVDYQLSNVRFLFDNPKGLRSAWGDPYRPCNNWLSIGGSYEPMPWNNSGQQDYVAQVQNWLSNKVWQEPSFPPAIPISRVANGRQPGSE
jgi:hypothetical protein